LQISGDLTLRAAQIYPTTLSTFNIFAYEKMSRRFEWGGEHRRGPGFSGSSAGLWRRSPLLGSTVQSIIGTAVTLGVEPTPTITGNTAVSFEPGSGSVTIIGSGRATRPSPRAAASIFRVTITQCGVLRAPQGSITLGWDGNDFDRRRPPSMLADPVARRGGRRFPFPQVILQAGSQTSVAG